MLNRIGTLLAVALALCAAQIEVFGAGEIPLSRQQAELSFGGQATQIPFCQAVNPVCQTSAATCAGIGNAQGGQVCAQSSGSYIKKTYSFYCKADATNAANSCTEYQKDVNGDIPYCIEYHRCNWNGFDCVDTMVVTGGVRGYFSVGSNCGVQL